MRTKRSPPPSLEGGFFFFLFDALWNLFYISPGPFVDNINRRLRIISGKAHFLSNDFNKFRKQTDNICKWSIIPMATEVFSVSLLKRASNK